MRQVQLIEFSIISNKVFFLTGSNKQQPSMSKCNVWSNIAIVLILNFQY